MLGCGTLGTGSNAAFLRDDLPFLARSSDAVTGGGGGGVRLEVPSLADVAVAVVGRSAGESADLLVGLDSFMCDPCNNPQCARREVEGAAAELFKHCARCKGVKYCTAICQKVGWKAHKRVCFATPKE